ncbi:MAG TPA: hypothetical protein VLS25_07940, partial [Dehalococcoidia bacterium]|nr:hypothetical protein [Dehalococcoidia bacterium]
MQQTARLRTGASAFPFSAASLAPYVLWPLLAVGLGELALFRTLSRVGVHIPKQGIVLEVYKLLVHVGSFAFNVSSIAVVVAVALVAFAALRGEFGRRPLLAAAAPALAAFVGISVLFAFTEEGTTGKLVYGLMSAALMLALAGEACIDRRRAPLRSLVVMIAVLAYLGAQYHVLAAQAWQLMGVTAEPPGSMPALEAAEALVLLNAFLIFWGWSGVRLRREARPTFPQLGVACLLVVLFLGSYYGRPDSSTASILSLWSLGLTLYLPVPLYALALGLYGATLAHCLVQARRAVRPSWDAVALGLLPVAGLTLELTYQHLVALLVLSLLLVGHERQGREAHEAD